MQRGWMRGLAAVLLAAAMYLAQPTAAQAAIEQEVVYDDGWYLLAHTAPDGTEAVFTPDGCVEINGERFDAPVRTWLAELTRLDDLPLTAPQAQPGC